ncbi:MAG TPA: A/G-specific adenine glycosylase [Anaerolineae bacterium]|nr:A/G-specific adenine glycosylase [Anaerolineae bacterium]HMR63169.1 A/G-specific adenine glycosylase [Anaerolineae bacterium]
MSRIPADTRQTVRAELLAWYRQQGRDLPWRGELSPYRIWLSEVMLQQTQVTTVIPYYHRFLARFPTLPDLAAAPLEEVLKAWEGLGYYARARNLHRAARELVEKWHGQFPESYQELHQLPGFGAYTAGAVASIAFGEAVPAVDGNVKRVLARLFAVESDVTRGPGAQQIRELAAALVDPDSPGDWTQALMELGATVCLPKSPRCLLCPVRELCQGRRQGIELSLPVKPAKKALPHYEVTAAVIRDGNKLLIAQRPPEGMLGGLWEFPGGKCEAGETLPACLRREIEEELGVEIEVGPLITVVKHGYTHFKITLHAFECRLVAGHPQALGVADWRWVTLEELDAFPFPRTDRQIIEVLQGRSNKKDLSK